LKRFIADSDSLSPSVATNEPPLLPDVPTRIAHPSQRATCLGMYEGGTGEAMRLDDGATMRLAPMRNARLNSGRGECS
jgi:hypothetical protein